MEHPPHIDSPEHLELIAKAQPERLTDEHWRKLQDWMRTTGKILELPTHASDSGRPARRGEVA